MPTLPSRRDGLLAILITASSAVWPASRPALRVGSKIDTEGALLGQLMLQVLKSGGVPTENRLQLGGTQILRQALVSGEIDLYPEYTGNGAFFFADARHPAWRDRQAGYERARALDLQRNRLVWLPPAPANNGWAIAVRQDLAQRHKLQTLDDLARWLAAGGQFKLAASAEFIERQDALPALQAAYGFKLRSEQLLSLAGGDTALTIKAAAEQISGVNGAMAYGTDGPLAALGLVMLADPRAVQPVYAPAPLARADALARWPQIDPLLAPVFRLLDNPTLQGLNAQIALEGRDAQQVAAVWLKSRGLLK